MGKGVMIAVRISNRIDEVPDVQSVFTNHGCNIKARLGLHEVSDNSCAKDGLIVLVCVGDHGEIKDLENELNKIDGVKASSLDLPIF